MMNAKAEGTTVGTTPQYLTIGSTKIIDNGKFQNNEVSGNDTIYQGTNWYYDRTKNQLVLENASISGHITSMNGDLSIILSGTNTMKSEMLIQSILTAVSYTHLVLMRKCLRRLISRHFRKHTTKTKCR